ncbi:MAG: type I restriction endonuclease subunit M [Bacteroidetes bacterium]|nr:MAG: type I restriction endonuclease subunit M [Bacteroidota bacterium]
MTSKKHTGSYYTPVYLADFVSKRVLSFFNNRTRISILEPSVGDGAFINSISNNKNTLSIKLNALDINSEELKLASEKWADKNSEFKQIDFLEFEHKSKFSAIIGNPPYIKKNRLNEQQIEFCKKIHKDKELSGHTVKNIWTTFLIKSIAHLSNNGVLAFILPSELLQVKFAEEIREYLKNEFERIEIFTFNDLMFECKGQDTIVLFAYKKHNIKGEFFTNIKFKEELENNSFILKQNNLLIESKVKWTHHFLTSDELTFLYKLRNQLKSTSYYSVSKPGIVTASNKFFIIDKEIEKEYKLARFTKPIIQKGLFVNGSVVFNENDFDSLERSNLPTKLLQLNNDVRISKNLRKYLSIGEELKIPDRYKCKIRNNWYVIPNIAERPEAFFFKRSHLYPKLLKNNSEALVTDSAYKVKMNNGFNLNSFIYSFYNSLTLTFLEIEGRYYGGGVLELTPSEFKKLPIPYTSIDNNQFDSFTSDFENKDNIEQILLQNDYKILNTALGINREELSILREIRKKLIQKRLRK